MPELRLRISDHVIATIHQWQNWCDVKVTYEWFDDEVRSLILNHTVEADEFRADLWDTRWNDTMWDLRKVQGAIDSGMQLAFNAHWRGMLKGLSPREIVASDDAPTYVAFHFVNNPNGGMDEYIVSGNLVMHMSHHLTIDDIIKRMWEVNPKIDGWVKCAKGDIYPNLEDDYPFNPDEDEPTDEAFIEFATPRLAEIKTMQNLVLVGKRAGLNYKMVFRWDGIGWESVCEDVEGFIEGSRVVYANEAVVIDMMWECNPSMTEWRVLQQEKTGRFYTVLTCHWNEGFESE